jgi:hypothetical protein
VVLPVALFLLGVPWRAPVIDATTVTAAATALRLQPDASQLSAFAVAMLVLSTSRTTAQNRMPALIVND